MGTISQLNSPQVHNCTIEASMVFMVQRITCYGENGKNGINHCNMQIKIYTNLGPGYLVVQNLKKAAMEEKNSKESGMEIQILYEAAL